MLVVERETVRFVYFEALQTMDHDAALAHAADECGVAVEAVREAVDEEALA